jgi:hypothetical protein
VDCSILESSGTEGWPWFIFSVTLSHYRDFVLSTKYLLKTCLMSLNHDSHHFCPDPGVSMSDGLESEERSVTFDYNIGKASSCLTERGKGKLKESKVAIADLVAGIGVTPAL